MTSTILSRRGLLPWTVALCVPTVALAFLPGNAIAADSGPSTVRAVVDGDGTVTSVKQYAADGAASGFSGKLPVGLSVRRSSDKGRTVYDYRVKNTQSETQDVSYTDAAGKTHSSKVELQLPLVAQLGVTLPSTMKDVQATGATIMTDADGTRHALWEMVLFSPLGSAEQDVYVSATGTGTPAAQVRAAAVDPATAPGLSGTAQAANAASTQDDFWSLYASGGNDGLTKLRDGMTKIVAGLELLAPGAQQLASGLGAAVDGAQKLDAGTAKAKTGADQLSAGLGKIHDGQSALTTGLVQLHDGLGQLADPAKGLPAAVAGLKQIEGGMAKLQAGVGDDATTGTLINGVDQVQAGVTAIKAGIADPAKGVASGVGCAAKVVGLVATGSGAATGKVDPCFGGPIPPLPGVDAVSAAVLGKYAVILGQIYTGLTTQVIPGLTALETGLAKIRAGLSHPATSAADPGGVKEALVLLSGGLAQVDAGLTKAVSGTNLLYAGAGKALGGSQQLATGSGTAYTGSKDLASGLSQLSTGQHQVAAGLPAAVTGAVKIADGLASVLTGGRQVRDGIGSAQDKAVGPLDQQLAQASQNARQQLAVLKASAALAAKAPGGAGTSYVLAQDGSDFRLAGSSSSADHTARNVGVGVAGLVLLLFGLAGGFAAGRRRGVVAP